MLRYCLIFNVLFFFFFLAFNQNLIPNPDFEDYKKCPTRTGQIDGFLLHWKNPSNASPDFFHSCSSKFSVPKNPGGTQDAHSGDGYVRLLAYISSNMYREYIQAELTKTLEKDKIYCLKFYISLADNSKYCTDRIGMLFTKKANTLKDSSPIFATPQVETQTGTMLKDSLSWTCIHEIFKAEGGEKFITIGNFRDDSLINIEPLVDVNSISWIEREYAGAFYYIDDLSLIEINNEADCFCTQEIVEVKVNTTEIIETQEVIEEKPIILPNIFFETQKSELLPESYTELDELIEFLLETGEAHIEILGHTDNVGSEELNRKLSEARAKAVVEYIINMGIDKNRLSYKGLGSSKPIDDNTTETGRAANRRVEVIIKR